jgi:hypothetical protein
MSGLILEALLALVILVVIVWWTMFSGRPGGEVPRAEEDGEAQESANEARSRAAKPPKD